jgi:NADH-quinone oxidoreductase subunit L
MFVAAGVGVYSAAMFHLFTHAFFKALLFLGAGSVIHALHHEQDMRKMGGIWRKVPWTYTGMIIGTLALTGVGIPLMGIGFAGFFSKDFVIEAAYEVGAAGGNNAAVFAFWMGLVAALMTSFYSWRLIFMTFHGKYRGDDHTLAHAHESPWSMRVPLVVLSIGAIVVGAVFYESFRYNLNDFWHGALPGAGKDYASAPANLYAAGEGYEGAHGGGHKYPLWVLFSPLVVTALGFILAWAMYRRDGTQKRINEVEATGGSPLYRFLLNKWYVDEIYDATIVRGARALGDFFWKVVDVGIVDRFGPNGVASFTAGASRRLSRLQSGKVFHYAFVMLIGVAVLIVIGVRGLGG